MYAMPLHTAILALAALCASSAAAAPAAADPLIALNVNYSAFLPQADPTWNWTAATFKPLEWVDSLFGGNGELGFLLFAPTATSLRLEVSRQSLYDDRNASVPYLNNFVFDQPRLPVGYVTIAWTSGAPAAAVTGRLSLHDARATVHVTTPSGALDLSVYAQAAWDTAADVLVLEASGSGSEQPALAFTPYPAQSTWIGRDARYVPNPPPVNGSSSPAPGTTLNTTTQAHLLGTAHCTAVLADAAAPGLLLLSVSPTLPSPSAAEAWAGGQVLAARALGAAALRAAHEAWWHAWWPAGGFLTTDFTVAEGFFYLQLYKMGSAARPGRSVHDLEGPWFVPGTDWPDLHWDLNLQYTMYLTTAVNRFDLARSYVDFFASPTVLASLRGNVPAGWSDASAAPTGASSLAAAETCYWSYGENCTTSPPSVTGNLLWCLQVLRQVAVHSANATIDTEVLWPLLGRALQFHAHLHSSNASSSGGIHLVPTFSPEYPGPAFADCNYDLSLYRWGLQLALQLASEYGLPSPHLADWAATLSALAPPPVDPVTDTLEIYAGHPYATPHRHFSHLFSIWPLRLVDAANASQMTTARNSINLWLATPEQDSMFYRPAASAMNVLLGQRAAAFDNITTLLYNRIEGTGFYREGAAGSCTETPYAAAWSLTDWLLQSWNSSAAVSAGAPIYDFFPGISDVIPLAQGDYEAAPSRAASASFWRLSAARGVLASGARALVSRNATHHVTRTAWVAVEVGAAAAAAGATLTLRARLALPLAVSPAGTPFTVLEGGGGGQEGLLVALTLPPGQAGAALFSAALPPPQLAVAPAAGCPGDYNYYSIGARSGAPPPPSPPAGAPLTLKPCTGSPRQRFAFNASSGQLALGDGSGRCVGVGSCTGELGALVAAVPCAAAAPPPPQPQPPGGGVPVGCKSWGGGDSCALDAQTWQVNPPGFPENALVLRVSGRCMEVHGAFDVRGGAAGARARVQGCSVPPSPPLRHTPHLRHSHTPLTAQHD